MRKKHEPKVWVDPDKFIYMERLKMYIGEEAFTAFSEDEKDDKTAFYAFFFSIIDFYIDMKKLEKGADHIVLEKKMDGFYATFKKPFSVPSKTSFLSLIERLNTEKDLS